MKKAYTALVILMIVGLAPDSFSQAGSGHALDLNGSTTFVECGTINLNSSTITLQAWIKVQAFKTTSPWISSVIGTEDPTLNSSAFIRLGDGNLAPEKPQFVLRINSAPQKLDAISSLTANRWYHLAATYDGTTMRLYINGVLDNSLTVSGTIASNSTFVLGRNYENGRVLNGEIDEASVFNATLSETTIRDYMCKSITPSHPNYSALLGYWPMNEGSGTTVEDMSPNNYNGTFVSNPVWKYSGAPIGDVSKYVYNGTSFDLGLSHPDGDSINITSTNSGFQGVHLYRVDSIPNVTTAPSGVQHIDTTRYWGIFPIGTANYNVDYFYNGNTSAVGYTCNLAFGKRNNNSSTSWSLQNPVTFNYSSQILGFPSNGRNEINLAISQGGPHTLSYAIQEPSCNGDNDGNATVSVAGGLAPYSYLWNTGSTINSSGSVAAGFAHVTVTDANSCVSEDSVLVTEPSPLSASSNITGTICKDTNTGTISLSSIGGTAPYSYLWNNANNSTTSSIGSLSAGSYQVTITDANACTFTSSYAVTSIGPDPSPFLGNDTNLCNGIVYGLTAKGGPFVTQTWSNGVSAPIIVINAPGVYSVFVENAAGCSASDTININYVAAQQVSLGSNTKVLFGSLILDAGIGFDSYSWNTGATTPSITVNSIGTYWVKATDSNKCKAGDTVDVVMPAQGVHELSLQKFSVYPNPVNEVLNIKATNGSTSISKLEVFDITGKSILISKNQTLLDVATFSSGIYFISITSNQGETEKFKFHKL